MIEAGDKALIIDNPVSRTVEGHGGKPAIVLRMVDGDIAVIQIEGMGRIGERRVLITDLRPTGQLKLWG